MRPAPVAVATCVGFAVLALAHAPAVRAQVIGITLGAPFATAGAPPAAPAYGPYVGRSQEPGALTPETVEGHLLARGFSRIANLKLRGGSYVCEATGPRRERVRLVVDATSGEISGVQVIGFEDKRY